MYSVNNGKDFNKVNDFKGNLTNAPITTEVDKKKAQPYKGSIWKQKVNEKIVAQKFQGYNGNVGTNPKPAKNYELPPDYYGKRKRFKGAALALIAANRSKPKPIKPKTPPRRQKTPPPAVRIQTPPPREPSPWRPEPVPVTYRRASPPPERQIFSRTSRPAPIFPPLVPVYSNEPDLIIVSQTQADVLVQRTRFPMIQVSNSPRVELVSDRVYEYPSEKVERYIKNRYSNDDYDYARLSYRQNQVPGYGVVESILRTPRRYGY